MKNLILLPTILLLATVATAQQPTIDVTRMIMLGGVVVIAVDNPAAVPGTRCLVKVTKPDGTKETVYIGDFGPTGVAIGGYIPQNLGMHLYNYGQPVQAIGFVR